MHVVLDQRRVRYVVVSADEVRRFAPLPRTVYLVKRIFRLRIFTQVLIARSALSIRAAHQILMFVMCVCTENN